MILSLILQSAVAQKRMDSVFNAFSIAVARSARFLATLALGN
jgi:hypothetical protein